MSKDLPPQFLNEENEEVCPSCAHVDACIFKGVQQGLAGAAIDLSVSASSDAFNTEAAVHGVRAAYDRRVNASMVNDQIDCILQLNCLEVARGAADAKPDTDLT